MELPNIFLDIGITGDLYETAARTAFIKKHDLKIENAQNLVSNLINIQSVHIFKFVYQIDIISV